MTLDEMKRRLNADYHDMPTTEIIRMIDQINKLEEEERRKQ